MTEGKIVPVKNKNETKRVNEIGERNSEIAPRLDEQRGNVPAGTGVTINRATL